MAGSGLLTIAACERTGSEERGLPRPTVTAATTPPADTFKTIAAAAACSAPPSRRRRARRG